MDFYSTDTPTPSGTSAGGKYLLAPAPIMEASALLTRRIHHQKQLISKAKAEARRNSSINLVPPDQCTNDGSPRTPEKKSRDPSSNHPYSLSTPDYRSIGRSNGSVDSDTIRFGGMGMREQTEIISQKSKENFGLKLMLTKSREQALRCEKELKNLRIKFERVQARNEVLERENIELKATIQGRDVVLDAAAKEIAVCQTKLAEFSEGESVLEASGDQQELSDMASTNINSDTTLVSGGPLSFGISPYAFCDSLTSLYNDQETTYSPCTSNALGIIDFNTPCSGTSSSLTGASPLPSQTLIRHPRNDFIDRCASALSESPGLKRSSSGGSSQESLPSIISESSLSMYGGRGNNGGGADADIFYDHRPGPHNENGGDRLNIKRWGIHGQSDMNALTQTPTRNPSTTRRSPRAEIMEFRDKQETHQCQDTMQNMPPTPDSMSPRRRTGGSFDSISSNDGNEANYGLDLIASIEDTDDSKTETLENNRGSRNSVKTIQRSDVAPSPLQKGVREIADRLRSPFKFPIGGSVAQKEPQTFGDITHLRETKKRLGYGFGSKLGNIAAPSKQPGRDISGHSRRLTVSKSSKDKLITVPVKPVTTNLPVRSRIRLSTQQPGQGLKTPPYTPNNDTATSNDSEKTTLVPRSLMKKLSWESMNSSSNSNAGSDGVPRSAYNSPHTIGANPSYPRRNSTATLVTTDMSAMTLRTVKDIRRMSAIPALVRGGSLNEKSRRQERAGGAAV